MKKIILKKLSLENWKSQNRDIEFNALNTIIKGKNGVGKSTVFYAWSWLLSGYTTPFYPKNHELYDNRQALSFTTPEAVVKALIEIDGNEYILERRAKATFTRKRGSEEYVKSNSDTYTFLIDGIEVSNNKYKEWIEYNICPVDKLIYSISGEFFSYLCEEDKNKAREILSDIIGDINDKDFIGDYEILQEYLGKYSIEQILEKTQGELKLLNKKVSEIHTLIKSKQDDLHECSDNNNDDIISQIQEKRQLINDIDLLISGCRDKISPIIEKREKILSEINDKTSELNEYINRYKHKYNDSIFELKSKISNIERDNEYISQKNKRNEDIYNSLQQDLINLNKELEIENTKRNQLLKQRDDVKAKVFNDETCAYCGQTLPEDIITDAKDKFNKIKSEELQNIVSKGKLCRDIINKLEEKKQRLQEEIGKGYTTEPLKSIKEYQEELLSLKEQELSYINDETYISLEKDIENLNLLLPQPQKLNDISPLISQKNTLLDELDSLNRELGLMDKKSKISSDIRNLQNELRTITSNIVKLEGVIAKIKEYNQEKATIVSKRVNSKLKGYKIQMFNTQKDGSLKDDCIITDIKGVKYSTLNNSARIKANIELQRMFLEHYNISFPIWIDEASIFSEDNIPIYSDTQMIFLYADNCDFFVKKI